MPRKNQSDYEDAANTAPSERDDAQKALMSDARKRGMTSITNIDHATKKRVKTYGS